MAECAAVSTGTTTAAGQVVVIVRHADAVPGFPDRARPLSPRGVEEAERVAAKVAGLGIVIAEVRHSGRERARHTAEILSRGCRAAEPVATPGLDPEDDPDEVALELQLIPQPVAVVSHMPLVARLASRLLTGDADRAPVLFPTAGALVLRRVDGCWERLAVLAP